MTSLFEQEQFPEPDPETPRRVGAISAILIFCLSFVVDAISVSNSKGSTAPIGYIFLPFISAALSVPAFGIGWCAGYFFTWRRTRIRVRKVQAFAAALVPLLSAGWVVNAVWRGNALAQHVNRIQTMDGVQLEAILKQPRLANNKYILGAIAGNPKATAAALHQIVTSDRPELYDRMGSLFDVLGTNTRGIAVMRLVAKHANTTPADLETLATHPGNNFVLSDVATNPGLPEAALRSLAKQGGASVEYGLAWNRRTPGDILAGLAASTNEYTRGAVAGNVNTPTEVLTGLSVDPVWSVRQNVAMNPATPRSIIDVLLRDADDRVRRAAKTRAG